MNNYQLFKKVFMLASQGAMMLAMMFIISCSGNNDKPNEPMNQVEDERILGTWHRCYNNTLYGDGSFNYEVFIFNPDFVCEYTLWQIYADGYDSVLSHTIGTFELKDNVLTSVFAPTDIELGVDEEGEYLKAFCNYIYRREKCY